VAGEQAIIRVLAKRVLPPQLARRGARPLLPRIFSPREAAVVLRVSPDTVIKWIRRGVLGGFRLGPGRGALMTTDLDLLAHMGWASPGRMPKPIEDNPSGKALDGHRPAEKDPTYASRKLDPIRRRYPGGLGRATDRPGRAVDRVS